MLILSVKLKVSGLGYVLWDNELTRTLTILSTTGEKKNKNIINMWMLNL